METTPINKNPKKRKLVVDESDDEEIHVAKSRSIKAFFPPSVSMEKRKVEDPLLQNRIDQANENEKGWRRQLGEYMDRKRKLEEPSEQSRLLSEIPKVIPETVDTQ